MARTFTSTLTVELIDKVTGAARRVGSSLGKLDGSIAAAASPRTRLDAAMARNEAALSRARAGLIDAAAGGWALKGAFDKTTGAAMALEDKMADIAKVSNMSDIQLKAFEKSLRSLSRSEIPLAVEELADLAAAAAQSGIDDNDLEAFTKQVAKSAVAWGVSGEYAGESLAKIKTALGLTIDETTKYADAINYLADSGASNAPDLIEFARRVAADGKVAGFSNTEVLTLGASMISMGAQADVAATSLRNAQKALTKGTSATKRQDGAFKKLGLHADDVAKAMPNDAMGQFLNVLERIRALPQHERISTMSDLFGDEARALMPLLGELDTLRKNVRSTADETNYLGSVQREFTKKSATGRVVLAKFNNQLREVAIVIGQSLLPAMKTTLESLGPVVLKVAAWAEANGGLVASISAAVAGLVGLRVAFAGLRFLAVAAISPLLRIGSVLLTISSAAGRIWGAGRAMVALHTALAAMGGTTLTGLQRVLLALRGMIGAIPGVSHLARAFGAVGGAVAGVLRSVGMIGPAMTRAAASTEAATTRMAKAISRVKFGGLLLGASMAWAAANAPSTVEDMARTRQENSKAIDDTLRSTPVIGSAMRGYDRAYKWVHGEDAPGAPDAARAKGGPISRGENVLVGEDGPEVISARRSGYVHPNGSAGAGGGIQINAPITIHAAPGESAEQLARRVVDLMEQQTAFQIRSVLADID